MARFMPAVGPALSAPAGEWGYVRVPGAWHRSGRTAPPLNGVVAAGSGAVWDDVPLAELARAWYEREIVVPETWRGREILLDVDRLCTDAVVYVNGTECGRINWPHGKVVLTPFVEPGEKVLLRLLVVSAGDAEKVEELMSGALAAEEGMGGSHARGLVGDVILESRPRAARIAGVFVQTSVRRKELKLDIDLVDIASPGRAAFTATITDAEGNVARRFEGAADLAAQAEQTAQLKWQWDVPEISERSPFPWAHGRTFDRGSSVGLHSGAGHEIRT